MVDLSNFNIFIKFKAIFLSQILRLKLKKTQIKIFGDFNILQEENYY
jgi:hypothetical protein